jgi:hypothetical protein
LEILEIIDLKEPITNLPLSMKQLILRRTDNEIIERCRVPFGCELIVKSDIKILQDE